MRWQFLQKNEWIAVQAGTWIRPDPDRYSCGPGSVYIITVLVSFYMPTRFLLEVNFNYLIRCNKIGCNGNFIRQKFLLKLFNESLKILNFNHDTYIRRQLKICTAYKEQGLLFDQFQAFYWIESSHNHYACTTYSELPSNIRTMA